MADKKLGLDYKNELSLRGVIRNTLPLGQRITSFFKKPQQAALVFIGLACGAFFFSVFSDVFFLLGAMLAPWVYCIHKDSGLPMQIPQSSGLIDPNETHPATGKPLPAKGIIYLGNDQDTGEEIWLNDTQARTHMLFMGTTGSGKAQPLSSKVLLPGGAWKRMGDVKAGDLVATPDGGSAEVIKVFPQGVLKIYRLRIVGDFDSGWIPRKTRACADHLWSAIVGSKTGVFKTSELKSAMNSGLPVLIPVAIDEVNPIGSRWCRLESITEDGQEDSQCIYINHKDHLYVTDDLIVTHNTEFLLSLVYNALIHASGFIYVDGKADSALYGKIYSMARAAGREDDVLVVNFQTGARDVFGAQPYKMSNTVNSFAVGSSGMLSQLVVSLMSSGKEGKSDVWENRAISFVEALMKPLVFLRDNYGLLLDVEVIREFFDIKVIEQLALRDADKYPGLEPTLSGMKSYLNNLPGYDRNKFQNQGETALEQHGYITMQLVRTFNSLSDTYGYIMKTPLAEIDFLDVFLNRRILVVLLPALEKSPQELTNLGRIIVASIKATMAVGLGARIEGDWDRIITAKPTNSPSPFMCVLDEYGYYAVEGFAVVPAQARSLGFSAIFAGQDLPAFEKASKEEAKSTLANTNTKLVGKLECTQTYDYFKSLAGQGYYTRTGGFESNADLMNTYGDNQTASIEKYDRVSLDDLKGQKSGEWHMFFANKIVRIKSFYANPKPVKQLRVNHFIKVKRPSGAVLKSTKDALEFTRRAIMEPGGVKTDSPVSADLRDGDGSFSMAFSLCREMSPIEQALFSLSFVIEHKITPKKAREDLGKDEHQDQSIASEEAQNSEDESPELGIQKPGMSNGRSSIWIPDLMTTNTNLDDHAQEYFDNYGDNYDEDAEDDEVEGERDRIFDNPEEDFTTLSGMHVFGVPEQRRKGKPQQEQEVEPDVGDEQGILNPQKTRKGLERIERVLGHSASEASQISSVVTGRMSEVSRYPITKVDKEKVDIKTFESLAQKLLRTLELSNMAAEEKESGSKEGGR